MLPEELLAKIQSIEILSRRLLNEGLSGDFQSVFRGSGMQFKEFRNYVFGDDVRHISWSVSARSAEPVLKTYEEERERIVFLVVDVSASLRRGPWAKQKAETLALIAGILAMSAGNAKDKVGLILFTDRVESIITPAKGRTHVLRIIRDVLAFKPKGVQTNPDVALIRLLRVAKKPGVVFVLSDFEKLPDERVLTQLSRKHDLSLISVEHVFERNLPSMSGFLEVESAERGRPATIDMAANGARAIWNSLAGAREEKVHSLAQSTRCDHLHVHTESNIGMALKTFFSGHVAKTGRTR